MPNTDDLGLENTGIKTDSRGCLKIDDYLRTTVPGVYAAGDVAGKFISQESAASGTKRVIWGRNRQGRFSTFGRFPTSISASHREQY